MSKTRLFLADDHVLVREGLRLLLEAEPDFDVVGEAGDGREVLEKVDTLNPNLIVMDIGMPHLNGIEALRQIKRRFPNIKVIILSVYSDQQYIVQALSYGASGYLLKKVSRRELVKAVRTVMSGHHYLSPCISEKVAEASIYQREERPGSDLLTQREREILQLIGEGYRSKEIGNLLNISLKTVKNHRAHIMEKLKVHRQADLIKYAIRMGLVDLKHI